jgi:predicted ester cyclase
MTMGTRSHRLFGSVMVLALLGAACSSSSKEPKVLDAKQTDAGTQLGLKNIALFQRLVDEGLNQGKLSVMDEVLSPTVLDHQFYGPGYPPSKAGIKGLTAALRTAFPDMHATATTLVASNDGTQTFAQIETTGTNTGPYLGVPPSGRKIDLQIIESAKWKDGKMIEHWGVADNIALLTQMGFFPPDAAPSYKAENLAVKYREQMDDPARSAVVPAVKKSNLVDTNVALTEQLFKAGVNGHNMGVADQLASPGYVDHEVYGAGFPTGRDSVKAQIAVLGTAVPNIKTQIQQIAPIGDGSNVFLIMHSTGTNTGAYLGIPPTGREIGIDLMERVRLENGKVVEHWGISDNLGLLDDLGFIPPGSVPAFKPSLVDPQFQSQLG